MKKILQKIPIILISIIVIILVGNSLIRVSDSENDIGIFEEIFFGKSIFSFLQPPWSENYKRWDNASKGSDNVADVIAKYGKSLVDSDDLDNIRLETAKISNSAYQDAKNIDLEYLKKSNDDLPEMFSTKLTKALEFWTEGLNEKDNNKMLKGNQHYNEFLQWMQSKNREDFNGLR